MVRSSDMMRARSGVFVMLFSAFSWGCTASHFLARVPHGPTPVLNESALRSGIEVILGGERGSFSDARLKRLEESMRKTYAAIPKNEHGMLWHAGAGYVLHRHFLHRHAWSVLGLDPAGDFMALQNSSAASRVFAERVPGRVLDLFEQRFGGQGLGLKDLAVFAATLEHLVHEEAVERLRVAYQTYNFSFSVSLAFSDVERVIDTYMAYYLMASIMGEASILTPEIASWAYDVVAKVYPTWSQTQSFAHEVMKRTALGRQYMTFAEVVEVVDEIGDLYGRWQDSECRALKDMLVEFEDTAPGGAGRVRLADFYGKALREDVWQLSESVQSLRQMGAIDDSDPTDLRVLIANYVYSPTNCVAGSIFYSVCCIDECDDLLADIEGAFARPSLSVEEVIAHVAAMPSTTVQGNRTLPAWLLQRLDAVAAHHGGLVPLHGRLFAQWMHHAYPRECRYPHVAGTTDPSKTLLTIDSLESNSATDEEMRQYVESALSRERIAQNATKLDQPDDYSAMWTMEEEIVVLRQPVLVPEAAVQTPVLRIAALVLACVLVTLKGRSALDTLGESDGALPKHYV